MSTDPPRQPSGSRAPLAQDLSALVERDHGDRTAVAALDALHRLQSTLASLEQGQDRLETQLAASRRRNLGALLAVAAAVLVGAGFWWGSQQGAGRAALSGGELVAGRAADPLGDAVVGQDDELIRRLSASERERDAQVDENAELRRRLAASQVAIDGFDGEAVDTTRMEEKLQAALDSRNEQFGVTARLREELIDKDRRITELVASIDDLRTRSERPAPTGVLLSSTSERGLIAPDLPATVNTALAASGMLALEVLEADVDPEGVLVNLLVSRKDAWGNVEAIMQLERLEIEAVTGVVRLRLIHRVVDDKPPAEEVWPLERWPRKRWEETGLSLPAAEFLSVSRVIELLAPGLAEAGYRFDAVGGFDDGELTDLQLTELGPRGEALARIRAARGVVERDPQRLRLVEGSHVVDDDERPFWQGEMVIPLDMSDLRGWWALVP